MSTRQITYIAVLAAVYVVIGIYVTPLLPNPMLRGQGVIAINMVVVVVSGILLGPNAGALVGLIGTAANALLGPAGGRPYELGAIIPHTIMGFTAGVLARRNAWVAAFAIIVGHVLNVIVFVIARLPLLPLPVVAGGVALETVVDLIVIWLAVAVLRPVVRSAPV